MKIEITKKIVKNLETEDIKKIIRANYFAKNTIHTISIKETDEKKENCQATKFIYHQMVFNMIYDIFGDNKSSVKEKITNLISWLIEKKITIEELVIDITEEDLDKLRNIEIDTNITQEKKDKFLKVIEKTKSNQNNQILSRTDLITIFTFINQIRNNFFHGTKEAQKALELGQEDRFMIYSSFLEKLADKFIEMIKKEEILTLDDSTLSDDLKENLGLLQR